MPSSVTRMNAPWTPATSSRFRDTYKSSCMLLSSDRGTSVHVGSVVVLRLIFAGWARPTIPKSLGNQENGMVGRAHPTGEVAGHHREPDVSRFICRLPRMRLP